MLLGGALLWAVPAGAGCAPPSWWDDPSPGTAELVYVPASAEKGWTEQEAWQQAYNTGLATLRQRITSDTNLWSRLHLVGTDVPHDKTCQDALGRWRAWVLVSCPRDQFEKALDRAQKAAETGQARIPIFVAPFSFGRESEEQFSDIVAQYKALGYGNAVWQTVENLLYDRNFEILTSPAARTKDMLAEIMGQFAESPEGDVLLPDLVLLCNMNFFKVPTPRMIGLKTVEDQEYHAELKLELYEVKGANRNVKIPAMGEAKNRDLLVAIRQSAEAAVDQLATKWRER